MKYRLSIFVVILLGISCDEPANNPGGPQPEKTALYLVVGGDFSQDSVLIRLDRKTIANQKMTYDPVWSVCALFTLQVFPGTYTISCTSLENNISGQFTFSINEPSTVWIGQDSVINFTFYPNSPYLE